MTRHTIYIGSNNATHRLEQSKALAIINEYFEAYSATVITGYWKTAKERTLKVDIVTEAHDQPTFDLYREKVTALCHRLKTSLHQEAIMLETSLTDTIFIS